MSDILVFPQREDDRLRRALRQLDAALQAQAAAVAEFRTELHGLAEAVDGLDDSLTTYRHDIDLTAMTLRRVQAEALAAERAADALLVATRP